MLNKNIFKVALLGALSLAVVACSPTKKEAPVLPSVAPKPVPQPRPQKPKPAPQAETPKVGFVVPLSGPHVELGQALQNAAQLAVFDSKNHDLTVIFADSQGTAEGAHQAVQNLLNQGAKLVIGPVFSEEVQGIKALATARKVPVLAFTTDKAMADENVFVLGFSPQEQIQRVLSFAASQGLTRIATLVPATPYGKLVSDAVNQLEQQERITIVSRETYLPKDIGTPALAMKIEKIQESHPQALLIPEGGTALAGILPYLESYSLMQGDVQLLGSGQWDTPEVQKLSGLKGAWYASPLPESRQSFEAQYANVFGSPSPRIATLAYDAVALAAALAAHESLNAATLELPQGFDGIDGVFRFDNHVAQRGLAILEVGGGIKDPAARSFGK